MKLLAHETKTGYIVFARKEIKQGATLFGEELVRSEFFDLDYSLDLAKRVNELEKIIHIKEAELANIKIGTDKFFRCVKNLEKLTREYEKLSDLMAN